MYCSMTDSEVIMNTGVQWMGRIPCGLFSSTYLVQTMSLKAEKNHAEKQLTARQYLLKKNLKTAVIGYTTQYAVWNKKYTVLKHTVQMLKAHNKHP